MSLPGDRVFIIGGATSNDCENTSKVTYEVVDGKLEEKAPMWNARAGFGCAVYPNHS